jgi:hypothetical protein
MKTITAILLITILTLTITACSENLSSPPLRTGGQPDNMEVKSVGWGYSHNSLIPSLQNYFDADGMFELKYVVIGEYIEDTKAELIYDYHEGFDKDVVTSARAFNQLRVLEVLHGDIAVGDTVPIVKGYAFDEEQEVLYAFCNTTPMHKGDRWIYFLYYREELNAYFPMWGNNGRFPVPDQEIINVMEKFPQEVSRLREFNAEDNLSREEADRLLEMRNNATEKALEELDISALGVFSGDEFNFTVYAELIDHFNIKAQEWVNPGRRYDTMLIDLIRGTSDVT